MTDASVRLQTPRRRCNTAAAGERKTGSPAAFACRGPDWMQGNSIFGFFIFYTSGIMHNDYIYGIL